MLAKAKIINFVQQSVTVHCMIVSPNVHINSKIFVFETYFEIPGLNYKFDLVNNLIDLILNHLDLINYIFNNSIVINCINK